MILQSYKELKGGNFFETQCTSGFWFGHIPNVGRTKDISIPNFDQISQSAAEKLLLPISENKRPPS